MKQGQIKHWNDKKGYGFITPAEGGDDVFFHITHFSSEHRPAQGMYIEYQDSIDKKGRLQAQTVRPLPEKTTAGFNLSSLGKWRKTFATIALLVAGAFAASNGNFGDLLSGTKQPVSETESYESAYSAELQDTLELIKQGGPYPYSQDDSVFQNREGLLPEKEKGYYREYTVETPGADTRGAKRVVTGGQPPKKYYYTEDHYQSFVKLKVDNE